MSEAFIRASLQGRALMLPLEILNPESQHLVDVGRVHPLKLRVLFLFEPNYHYGMEHGSHLRVFNWTSQLISQGHEVYFAVRKNKTDDLTEKRKYLARLRQQEVFTDYFEVEYQYPRLRGKLAQLVVYPKLVNYLLHEAQSPVTRQISDFVTSRHIDVCVFMDRTLLFVLPEVKDQVRTVIDWVDSYVLHHARQLPLHFKRRELREALVVLRRLYGAYVEERYYGRLSAANALTSPADKRCIDRITRVSARNHVLLNGVKKAETRVPAKKDENRLIFTGNMVFPPNYESAIWFIDHVFPLLLQRRAATRLVIAGANPSKELLAKAGPHIKITGYVDDMQHEIGKSALYVAPLICGGGFKNKVVEAIASGTFVVATRMAVEFLNPTIREQLLIGDTPTELADRILTYFDNPEAFNARLPALQRLFEVELSWENSTRKLLEVLYNSPQDASSQDRPWAVGADAMNPASSI
jgi:glycosyltransferase involved in cell wall biosynthesis